MSKLKKLVLALRGERVFENANEMAKAAKAFRREFAKPKFLSSRIADLQMLENLGEAGEKVGDYIFDGDLGKLLGADNLIFIDDLLGS